jgi:hypothetical protein
MYLENQALWEDTHPITEPMANQAYKRSLGSSLLFLKLTGPSMSLPLVIDLEAISRPLQTP